MTSLSGSAHKSEQSDVPLHRIQSLLHRGLLSSSSLRVDLPMIITHGMVEELLSYDPETGILTWKKRGGKRKRFAGKEAGCVGKDGYIKVKLLSQNLLAHRLAWLLSYGRWPTGGLDHKDRNKTNNRLENLREATHSQNCMNRGLGKRNASGVKGVSFNNNVGKWQVSIGHNNAVIYLGCFADKDEAAATYKRAAAEILGDFEVTPCCPSSSIEREDLL